MEKKLDFIVSEIGRLSNLDFNKNWEVIFRYLVKLNSILSNENIKDSVLINVIKKLLEENKGNEIRTILNIFFSEIFKNRATPLSKDLYLGKIFDKEIPDFVDKNKLSKIQKLFEEDPIFLEKNIHIRGGWLDKKNPNSFTFEV